MVSINMIKFLSFVTIIGSLCINIVLMRIYVCKLCIYACAVSCLWRHADQLFAHQHKHTHVHAKICSVFYIPIA